MYIAPGSTVKFYQDIPIITGRQMVFSSKANQTAYFNSKLVATYTPTTYLRIDEILKIDTTILPFTTAMHVNYLSFVNPDFENITWYARITSSDYTNNGCVSFTYALDLFQTFLNDINFDTCVMDREQLSVTDYDKSVANPYDYDIIEMQTAEELPVDDFCYDYPAVTGRPKVYGPKRTFLPGGYEDGTAEQQADNTIVYTIVMSNPVNRCILDTARQKSATWKYLDYVDSIDAEPTPGFFTDYEGTFPEEAIIGMFNDAGLWDSVRQLLWDHLTYNPPSSFIPTTPRKELPVGNHLQCLIQHIKSEYNKSWNTGMSWIAWPYADGNTATDSGGKYDAGFGMFGGFTNNSPNQLLILGTSNWEKMNRILNSINEQNAISSIVGCYALPLSFCTMLHATSIDHFLNTGYNTLFSGSSEPPDYSPDGTRLGDDHNKLTVYTETVHPLDFSQVKNKKLLTFPYQYIKVTDPSGLIKEFKFEDFPKLQSNNSGDETNFNVQFTLLADILNGPRIEMYPYLYKMYETGDDVRMSFRKKLNVDERMEYTEIPQQGYMTDAFTSYLAQTYANEAIVNARNKLWSDQTGADGSAANIANAAKYNAGSKRGVIGAINSLMGSNNSVDATLLMSQSPYGESQRSLSNILPWQQNWFSGGYGLHGNDVYGRTTRATAGDTAGALSMSAAALQTGGRIGRNVANAVGPKGIANREATADAIALSAENSIADIRIRQAAMDWCNGDFHSSAYLSEAKSAFRVNDYHAGTGNGILPYFLKGFKFTFDVMKLKSTFIAKYDEYFTNYGYKSTRVGIPHIQTYLQGTKTGDAPKFLQNADGYYVTYVKTVICKVNHYNKTFASYLEGIFDGGIQLIDGDTLLPS